MTIYDFVCVFAHNIIPFLISLYYFNQYCTQKFHWYLGLSVTVLWFGITQFIPTFQHMSFVPLLFAFLFFLFYGTIILKCHLFQSVSVAALLISILYICNCITSAMGFWIAKNFAMGREYLFHYLNLILAVILLILLIAFHAVIIKIFYNSLQYLHNKIMLLLSGQILFIGIAEQMVLSVVYGDTIIWDMEQGLLLPIVNSAEIFILQFFACIGLISVLVTYRQLVKAIQTEQTVKLLEQQTNEQVTYVKEAQIREQQTRSFKHDIRNHFLLLHELLKKGQTTDALDYLSDLEEFTNTLTCQCRTGNSIIDTLLNSKFTIAAQKGIQTTCEILIPSSADIKDIDWCILLSNAIDNAIHASECVETENRYLHINGAQKGNFFLLTIENRCLKDTQNKFQEGIGISNIRAVVLKYNGTFHLEISDEVFRLNILFLISQH